MFKIVNKTPYDMKNVETMFSKFFPYAQKRLGFDKPVSVNLVSDEENAKDLYGKTAFYDPSKMSITIFVDNRHPKDMLRSFSHELVHHKQNCAGQFNNVTEMGEDYAQTNQHLRDMEAEAYLIGNGFLVRDYTDSNLQRESIVMNEKAIRSMTKIILEKLGDYPNMGMPVELEDESPCQDKMVEDPIIMKEEDDEEEEAHVEPGKEKADLEEASCGSHKRDTEEDEEEVVEESYECGPNATMDPSTGECVDNKGAEGGVKLEEEDKKPDEDGDGVPDWADKKSGKDDSDDDKEKNESILDRQAALKEHVNGGKNKLLFEELVKKWCK